MIVYYRTESLGFLQCSITDALVGKMQREVLFEQQSNEGLPTAANLDFYLYNIPIVQLETPVRTVVYC